MDNHRIISLVFFFLNGALALNQLYHGSWFWALVCGVLSAWSFKNYIDEKELW